MDSQNQATSGIPGFPQVCAGTLVSVHDRWFGKCAGRAAGQFFSIDKDVDAGPSPGMTVL
jgi:hypothetical protein